jgi:DNA modification methylase
MNMKHNHSLSTCPWAVEKLIPYARNARTHSDAQIAQIAASIAEFGFNNPVLIGPEGDIIAGHGRVLAARKLGLGEVPVITLSHLSDNQKRAFMLADNKIALNAEWDEDMLRLELEALAEEDYDLQLTGFEEEELQELIQKWEAENLEDPDEAPELDEQSITQTGELWRLGDHLVLCGDGTQEENLRRLLEGSSADLIFTDLPYNVDYTGKTSDRLKLRNDNLGAGFTTFLEAACQALLSVSSGAIYICMSSGELHHLHEAFSNAGGHWSTYVMWVKNSFTLGRSDYQRQYEPILYGWPEGQKHHWCGDRNQGDVWSVDKPSANKLHPTMKPVELIERAIHNSSKKHDLVLDPFAGSGSTIIACERMHRRARAVEIDPRYVDVLIKRWQSYTGQEAVREGDRRSFQQVVSDRS